MELTISTTKKHELADITDQLSRATPQTGSGLLVATVMHTTCALTTIDSDPGIDADLFDFLQGATPEVNWRHPHNPAHAPAHLWSSVIGPSLVLPYSRGELQLGTWQLAVLVELDGPRQRRVVVTSLS